MSLGDVFSRVSTQSGRLCEEAASLTAVEGDVMLPALKFRLAPDFFYSCLLLLHCWFILLLVSPTDPNMVETVFVQAGVSVL